MTRRLSARTGSGGRSQVVNLALLLMGAVGAHGQAQTPANPTLTLNPPGRTDLTQESVQVILTPPIGNIFPVRSTPTFTGGDNQPTSMIIASNVIRASATTLTATFTISENAWGKVNVNVGDLTNTFDTGVRCLEALELTGCALRWEV